jgi:hypothetical protein
MLQQTTLQGMSTAHLEQLRTQIALQFFADETTDNDREEMCKFDDMVMNCIPHSFVLASLFDVEAMCNEIPDHIYESDPSLEGVTCPCCDGEKWLEVEGNVWTKALFSDPRRAYAHRHLNHSYKVCGRCCGVGEVLDDLTSPAKGGYGMGYPNVLVWHGVSEVDATIKTTSQNPRTTPVSTELWRLAA